MNYLSCIKKVKGTNEAQCRNIAKTYLSCRMDRNLMAKDEFKNLGFGEEKPASAAKKDEGAGDGKKNELRW
ncbi:Cytochrome c oxidase assembly protein [Lachnellula hyalina]|uniref:Cytochrome c oxidase assembly protein n=1 Tax=Lachnellula hyalina TaxID=1316788 RepID=A0A8H8QTZ0_9HELO|nr:Cytochrome c oxidase assembly protein [Lachnellula hyalina]TVY22738.1 Cytochrome c oxidase assembly protein [Lachnellula hyalina]